MNKILKEILVAKAFEVKNDKNLRSTHSLEADKNLFEIRNFEKNLVYFAQTKKPAVVAEIKKASPSKGILKKNFNPSDIAISYESAGAACISVLTDRIFFKGSINDLVRAKKSCGLPILRKEFIIDPYQIFQSRAYGADCILLIVAALELNQMIELEDIANSLGMNVLIEVHDEQELELAMSCKTNLIGINNRNLNTFEVNIGNTLRLVPKIPKSKLIISESGISSYEDMMVLISAGVSCFLIGEFFMKKDNPGSCLKTLLHKF